jgi:hypothetical protein
MIYRMCLIQKLIVIVQQLPVFSIPNQFLKHAWYL